MTTTVITLTDAAWEEVATGPCFATFADSNKNIGAYSPKHENPNSKLVMVHIGAIAPVDGYAYHDWTEGPFSYTGTSKVWMRSALGDRVIKLTPVA